MAYVVVFVLDQVERCNAVLESWERVGAEGVTIVESTGLGRIRRAVRDDLPLMPSLREVLAGQETHHRTLFTVVRDVETAEDIIEATEQIVGDICRSNTGFLFVVPAVRVLGLGKRQDWKQGEGFPGE